MDHKTAKLEQHSVELVVDWRCGFCVGAIAMQLVPKESNFFLSGRVIFRCLVTFNKRTMSMHEPWHEKSVRLTLLFFSSLSLFLFIFRVLLV